MIIAGIHASWHRAARHAALALLTSICLAVVPGSSFAAPAAASGAALARGSWLWPVDGARVVVRPYLAPATPWGSGHRGIDIETAERAVLAPANGIVHFAGTVVDRPVLSIEHAGGLLSSFEPVQSDLVAGDRVTRGQIVGTLQSGHCAVRLCLHFGVRLAGEYVSPLLLLGGIPHSVLLPSRRRRVVRRAPSEPDSVDQAGKRFTPRSTKSRSVAAARGGPAALYARGWAIA